jgi:hypothetical protein
MIQHFSKIKSKAMCSGYSSLIRAAVVIMVVGFTSCSEQQRVIEPFVPEGNRVVLLEEFTGKGCTNCPKGSREIENLLIQFPDNLVAISLHAGFFANPQFFPLGTYDLRTDEGEFLFDYLGPNLGYPAGVVDRIAVNGDMQIGRNQWASAITSEIQVPPAIELNIVRTYDPASRTLQLTVDGIGKEDVSHEIRLSVALTESGIIDAQDDLEAGGIVPDYVHRHVLRDMLTPATGAPVLSSIITGQTFSNSFTYTIPQEWVAESMEIIAFVTVAEGTVYPVLQAASAHVTE